MIVYLGLGSNLGDRVGYLQQALSLLKDQPVARILPASSFYKAELAGYVFGLKRAIMEKSGFY